MALKPMADGSYAVWIDSVYVGRVFPTADGHSWKTSNSGAFYRSPQLAAWSLLRERPIIDTE